MICKRGGRNCRLRQIPALPTLLVQSAAATFITINQIDRSILATGTPFATEGCERRHVWERGRPPPERTFVGSEGMPGAFRIVSAAIAALSLYIVPAGATSRIKDLANIEGVRQNQLIGYGLVVGLNGSGDTLNNIPFTK